MGWPRIRPERSLKIFVAFKVSFVARFWYTWLMTGTDPKHIVRTENLTEGISAVYSWDFETGETQVTLVNEDTGESLTMNAAQVISAHQKNRFSGLVSEALSHTQVNRKSQAPLKEAGLVKSLSRQGVERWYRPEVENTSAYLTPYLLWVQNTKIMEWQVFLTGLENCGPVMTCQWNDAAKFLQISENMSDPETLSLALALLNPAPYKLVTEKRANDYNMREAFEALKDSKVSVTKVRDIVRRSGYSYYFTNHRFRVTLLPLKVPGASAKTRGFAIVVGYPDETLEAVIPPNRARIRADLEAAGYHKVGDFVADHGEHHRRDCEIYAVAYPHLLRAHQEGVLWYAKKKVESIRDWGQAV